MDTLEEQNSLQTPLNNKLTKHTNNAGRPKKNNEIKFSPQPISIVSQLLKANKIVHKHEQIEKYNNQDHDFQGTDEPQSKKKFIQEKPQGIKAHHCEHPSCTYTSKSSSNMIKHKRRHTAEKPYMCDQCTFRTNFINSLTVHKRIHSGERPFICEHCCYRCNSSSNLKKHLMHKHSGIT